MCIMDKPPSPLLWNINDMKMNSLTRTYFLIKLKFRNRLHLVGPVYMLPLPRHGLILCFNPSKGQIHQASPTWWHLILWPVIQTSPHLSRALWLSASISITWAFSIARSRFLTSLLRRLTVMSHSSHPPHTYPHTLWASTQLLFFLIEKSLALALFIE